MIILRELEDLRGQINEIDKALVNLFKKRMTIVSKVAEYKAKNSMEIFDGTREDQIINKHLQSIENESLKLSLKEFLQAMMTISRRSQEKIISEVLQGNKVEHNNTCCNVGFQGVKASFSHQALLEYFGTETETRCFSTFREVFDAVDRGDIKYAVLPIENSPTGSIAEIYDLLRKYGFYIIGEKCIKVNHNLMAVKGTDLSDIKEVYSHEQGFLQCKDFFDNHREWTLIPYFNTAKSALYISRENLKSKACVASKKAAEVYGLDILKENINYNSNNYTRFIIIGRHMEPKEECDKLTIVASLPHKVGALYGILKYFAENNSNMMKIESRPIADKSWEYFFYIDFQGNILEDRTKRIVEEIKEKSLYFKLLGNYKGEVNCI
ncbi:chorismate mutase [Clostridium sp. CX1]|nr:chorismate mutase [Clostridium sp. CX1]MCT8978401.1 chorismate mutase [Clostridium sp. CX1]